MTRPTLHDVLDARRRIEGRARSTPLHHSIWLSEHAGVPVYLKLECWQRTGSFKMRGAANAVASLDPESRARGLVTASAGNHGQAVALAAREDGIRADIFVPENAPAQKKLRIREYGATLHTVEGIYDQAAAAARAYAEEHGAYYLHAFVDPRVVAGQGTVGLEIGDALPDVRTVLVPVGGGGLIAGTGLALRETLDPPPRIVGVQSDATPAMHDAFAAGVVVESAMPPTIADGLAGQVEPASYERARAVAEDILLVPEERLAEGIRRLFLHDGVTAEGSGIVGVIAVLDGLVELDGPTVVVVSGGNIDPATLAGILSG